MGARSLPVPPGSARISEARGPERGDPESRDPVRPGPVTLPPGHRPRDPRWAWGISAAVVVLALVLYAVLRASAGGGGGPAGVAPPRWGPLTLRAVAIAAARSAGGRRPSSASWMSTQRGAALQALGLPQTTGPAADGAAEAEYVVVLRGDFRGPGDAALPGSAPSGLYMVALVRGFDGRVTGTLISGGDPAPALSSAGLLHRLPVRRFPF